MFAGITQERSSIVLKARRKGQHSEGDEARAVARAAWLWRDQRSPIPVVWGGRCLGVMRGDPDNNRSIWRPGPLPPGMHAGQGTYVPDYDTSINKLSAGKHYAIYWNKPGATASVIDNWYDLWGTDANPGKGNWSGTARTARAFTNTTAGAINIGANVSPSIRYLTRVSPFSGESTVRAMILYDRVIAYDACTMTAGAQLMTNTTTATRYVTNGDPGLQIFVEADTVHNATAAAMTVLTYVDNTGAAGSNVITTPVLTKIVSIAAPTALIGARNVFQTPGIATKSGNPYLTLQAGSEGVQQITNYTWNAAPTGTCSFVLQFPLALFPETVTAGVASDYDFCTGIESINKRIFDDACLSVLHNPHVTTTTYYHGWLEFGWT